MNTNYTFTKKDNVIIFLNYNIKYKYTWNVYNKTNGLLRNINSQILQYRWMIETLMIVHRILSIWHTKRAITMKSVDLAMKQIMPVY